MKTLFWNCEKSPANMIKFINLNKIKRKDILSIHRNNKNEIEIYFYSKKPFKSLDK